jgi:uncharacterized membrane protein
MVSLDRLRQLSAQIRERLWVRPLAVCLLSIGAVFTASIFDSTGLGPFVPITSDSIETLLSIMSASMLVIATFSVASMVSAYAAASSTATPRAFTLIIADDASQNALSAFVGAFIFSVVALTAVKNGYFETAGLFVLFVMTALVFSMVILTFVRWVDGIARLGRMASTIDKVERATAEALARRRDAPTLYGAVVRAEPDGLPMFAAKIGYLEHINMSALQAWAATANARLTVAALPGTFVTPERPLVYVSDCAESLSDYDFGPVIESFQIGTVRRFDDDPRFGLVVMSEIAGRALSPAVNDPGTAIDIVGRLVRLLHLWCEPAQAQAGAGLLYERVEVAEISLRDMFDDAFTAIARDGAGHVEVAVRLQKALCSLAAIGDETARDAANYHSRLALQRCKIALDMPQDLAVVRAAARFSAGGE